MLALISLDGDFDLPQHPFAGFADRCSEDAHGCRGVEVEDGLEVLVGEKVGGVKSAAAHQHVGGADGSRVFENRSQVVFIIFFEERTVNDTENIPLMLLPPAFDQLPGNGLQLKGEAHAPGNAEALLQRRGHAVLMLRSVLPKKRAAGIRAAACVGYVKNIFHPGRVPGAVDQRDALRAAPYIAVHGLVPDLIAGAGRGLRLLGEDQELLVIGVLIQSGRCFKKCRPCLEAFRRFPRSLGRQLRIELGFTRHCRLLRDLFLKKGSDELFCPSDPVKG